MINNDVRQSPSLWPSSAVRIAWWSVSIAVIFGLGALRTETDAEFTFASLALVPVLATAWFGGKSEGLSMAFVAASMWGASDVLSMRQFSAAWVPWVNVFVRLVLYGSVAMLAAQLRRQLIAERDRARLDPLTGLANRRAFFEAGTVEVSRSERYLHPLAVMFLDLDNFKQLNDSEGHDAGDTALLATAKALLRTMRSTDSLARLGGDEFAIVLPETSFDAAVDAGTRLLAAAKTVLAPFPPVTASIGVAWFQRADRPFEAMVREADKLMYAAKQRGKGVVQVQRFVDCKDVGRPGGARH